MMKESLAACAMIAILIGVPAYFTITSNKARAEEAPKAEREKPPARAIIFRDTDAEKVNTALNNFLATIDAADVVTVMQSEGPKSWNVNYQKVEPVLTITVIYRSRK